MSLSVHCLNAGAVAAAPQKLQVRGSWLAQQCPECESSQPLAHTVVRSADTCRAAQTVWQKLSLTCHMGICISPVPAPTNDCWLDAVLFPVHAQRIPACLHATSLHPYIQTTLKTLHT